MAESVYLLSTMTVVAAAFSAVFLAVRWLAERMISRPAQEILPGELILPEDQRRGQARSLAENIDISFNSLVRQTGVAWTPTAVLAATALLGVLAAGLVYFLTDELAWVALSLAAAALIPLLLLVNLRARRRKKIQSQMPDVFFLLARSLRAGLTLDQALVSAAQLGPAPIAGELHTAAEQCKLGLAAHAALQSVANRLKMVDFDSFVMTVSLHRNVGGNLSLLLDRLGASVRDRNLFRGYFRAATALGRVTAIFLAIAAPALFAGAMALQPDLISRFLATSSGWRMLAVSGALEVVGCVWLLWLLRIDY